MGHNRCAARWVATGGGARNADRAGNLIGPEIEHTEPSSQSDDRPLVMSRTADVRCAAGMPLPGQTTGLPRSGYATADRGTDIASLRQLRWPGQSGYLYDVIFTGDVPCTSGDPEHAACRALSPRGLTGIVTFVDAHRAKPRLVMDIESATALRIVETCCAGQYREFDASEGHE